MTQPFELPALEPLLVEDVPVAQLESAIGAARAEAEAIREAARAEGHAAGLAEAQGAVQAALAALQAGAQALEDERALLAEQAEQAAVELAFAVAEQVLATSLTQQRELVVGVVRGAMRRLMDRERITVLVNPEDLDVVRDAAPALVAELGGVEHCEVQSDRRVARGGAVVRTGEGEVDATLPAKLERAREAVDAALRGEQPTADDDDAFDA